MNQRLFFCIFFLIWLILPHHSVYSQDTTLVINFETVSLTDTIPRPERHLTELANFPFPVMSVITVKDSNGHFVHGLADTTRWLSGSDTNERGQVVEEVWKILYEYHRDNEDYPPDPDIKKTRPDFLITEMYDLEGYGLTVAAVMDYSRSMGEDIYLAEEGARSFFRLLKRTDHAALIKFSGKVELNQTFTNDTTLLMDALSRPPEGIRQHTALYDALHLALTELINQERGRKVVVAYTDGRDNYSSNSMQDVINLARAHDTPVFMIGLGDLVVAEELKPIADQTGGRYFPARTAADLAGIYENIYGLISGLYVMAHSSPDPFYNGTWRVVDITIDAADDSLLGRGTGQYFVPFRPSDIAAEKSVDTRVKEEFDIYSRNIVHASDTAHYSIVLRNHGPVWSSAMTVKDVLPESYVPFNISPEISQQSADTLIWEFESLDPDSSVFIQYSVIIDTLSLTDEIPLINTVLVSCASDTSDDNNRDTAVVYYRPPVPVDVALSKTAAADSMRQGIPYVSINDTVTFTIEAVNYGGLHAVSVDFTDILPDELELLDFPDQQYTFAGQKLEWSIDRLEARGGNRIFTYHCIVKQGAPAVSKILTNIAAAFSAQDSSPANNTDSAKVYYYPPAPVDIALYKRAVTDSFRVVSGDTLYYAGTGDTVNYHITAVNYGELTANDVSFEDNLPEGLRLLDFTGAPHVLDGDTILWSAAAIDSKSAMLFVYRCRLDAEQPPWETLLMNTVTAFCIEDSIPENNTASAAVRAYGIGPPDPQIAVSPKVIEPLEEVEVSVFSPIEVETWDIHVIFEDGSMISTYADAFIQSTSLVPGEWIRIIPDFSNTQMKTSREEEDVQVILFTTDKWNIARSDTDSFKILSSDEFFLDDNHWDPVRGPLGLRYKLGSNRPAKINIYDVSGSYIATPVDGPANAGWNSGIWDGKDNKGRDMGSGIYVAILSSGRFKKMQKFLLVR